MQKLYTFKGATKYLKCSQGTLSGHIGRGNIEVTRINGNRRFTKRALDHFKKFYNAGGRLAARAAQGEKVTQKPQQSMTSKQAIKELGISKNSLHSHVYKGHIEVERRDGRLFFKPTDVENFKKTLAKQPKGVPPLELAWAARSAAALKARIAKARAEDEVDSAKGSLLDMQQTAKKLDVTYTCLASHVKRGNIPFTRFGRAIMFNQKDVQAFKAARDRGEHTLQAAAAVANAVHSANAKARAEKPRVTGFTKPTAAAVPLTMAPLTMAQKYALMAKRPAPVPVESDDVKSATITPPLRGGSAGTDPDITDRFETVREDEDGSEAEFTPAFTAKRAMPGARYSESISKILMHKPLEISDDDAEKIRKVVGHTGSLTGDDIKKIEVLATLFGGDAYTKVIDGFNNGLVIELQDRQ